MKSLPPWRMDRRSLMKEEHISIPFPSLVVKSERPLLAYPLLDLEHGLT